MTPTARGGALLSGRSPGMGDAAGAKCAESGLALRGGA
jgi:hypothetical protein